MLNVKSGPEGCAALSASADLPGARNFRATVAGQAGLTLVEIVVAALILIASLAALLIAFSRSKHNAETAGRELHALQIARTEFEQFRATTYSNILSFGATALTNSALAALNGTKECSVADSNGYKEIRLAIRWSSTVGAQTISQTFNTVICNTN